METNNRSRTNWVLIIAISMIIIFTLGGFFGGIEVTKAKFESKVKESIILGCFLFESKNPNGTFSEAKTVYRITMDSIIETENP